MEVSGLLLNICQEMVNPKYLEGMVTHPVVVVVEGEYRLRLETPHLVARSKLLEDQAGW